MAEAAGLGAARMRRSIGGVGGGGAANADSFMVEVARPAFATAKPLFEW